jgi:hypothetical protein
VQSPSTLQDPLVPPLQVPEIGGHWPAPVQDRALLLEQAPAFAHAGSVVLPL